MSATALVLADPIPLPKLVQSPEPIALALDAVSHQQRINWMRSLGAGQLATLFELSQGHRAASVSDIVGDEGEVVIAEGKNGLPLLFNRFQKRFARLGDEVVGYNHNPWIVMAVIGYGHFVAEDSPEVEGEVWINYCKVPKAQHPDFPKVHHNDYWPASWAYGDMIDIVRRVSTHLFIGRSIKPSGKWGPNDGQHFAIARPPRD